MSYEKDHFKSLRGFSDRAAGLMGWTTPNIVTLTGFVLVWPMLWAFLTGRTALGAVLFGASALTDFLDGALARWQHDAMTEEERAAESRKFMLFRRGMTDGETRGLLEWFLSGTNLDPLTDKVRYFAAMLVLGWEPLDGRLMLLAGLLALTLTAGRPILKGLARRGGFVYTGTANVFGKYKAHAEIVLIAGLLAYAFWRFPPTWILNGLFIAATGLALLSVVGQLASYRKSKTSP